MLHQVNIDKDPTFPDLGAGDFSEACFLGQGDGMNLEESGSFLQGERSHCFISKNKPNLPDDLPPARHTRLRRPWP